MLNAQQIDDRMGELGELLHVQIPKIMPVMDERLLASATHVWERMKDVADMAKRAAEAEKDSRRISWLEETQTLNTRLVGTDGSAGGKWTEFDYSADKTLREAIDERMGK